MLEVEAVSKWQDSPYRFHRMNEDVFAGIEDIRKTVLRAALNVATELEE